MFGCGRDRVVSARIQWMAAADAPQRQPAPAQRSVAGDRLHGGFRAGWHETAAFPEAGAPPAFVAPLEGGEETIAPRWSGGTSGKAVSREGLGQIVWVCGV